MNEDSSVDIVLEGSGDDDETVTFSISEDPKNGDPIPNASNIIGC